MALMIARDYAAHRGVTKASVSNWKSKGLLVWAADPGRTGGLMIDVEKSDAILNAMVDQTRGRPRAGDREMASEAPALAASVGAMSKMEAARLDEMLERTLRRRLDNQVLVGALVPLAEYERRAGEMGRMVRDRTVGIIRQLAERLAAETDPRQVITLLTDQFDLLFAQLADEIEAAAKVEAGVDAVLAVEAAEEDEDLEAV